MVNFPDSYFNDLNFLLDEHQVIAEGMFSDAGYNLKTFLNETDENTKNTIISEVNNQTTKKLIKEWKEMHFKAEDLEVGLVTDLKISLQQNRQNNHALDVNITESFKDTSGTKREISMLLSERSLGFRWFFNFSAKKCFGARGEEKFIYLFDEPGSYLHNGAQDILLKAIRDLANNHPVIYSTTQNFYLIPKL